VHETARLREGDDNSLVVLHITKGESAILTVLEPLFEDLVTADPESPHLLRHALEVLILTATSW
jgi:hypothetical protein